jgi:hypothetical protein
MPAAWWLRLVPSIALHAGAVMVVVFGGDVFHRAQAAPEDHVVSRAVMTAWFPPASSSPLVAEVHERERARVVVNHPKKVIPAEIAIARAPVRPVVPVEVAFTKPEPPPAPFDPLAFSPPPSAAPAPAPTPTDDNLSVLFVGIENGEWLRWLSERHGAIGFTTRRDDVIERVYSVAGELLPTSSAAVADLWALEINQPEHVAAIAEMLGRERARADDADGRIRVFALFPASFRDEVTAAIHRAGGAGGVFLVSFSGNDLQVAASTPASPPTH